jgi:hypothetical protein
MLYEELGVAKDKFDLKLLQSRNGTAQEVDPSQMLTVGAVNVRMWPREKHSCLNIYRAITLQPLNISFARLLSRRLARTLHNPPALCHDDEFSCLSRYRPPRRFVSMVCALYGSYCSIGDDVFLSIRSVHGPPACCAGE